MRDQKKVARMEMGVVSDPSVFRSSDLIRNRDLLSVPLVFIIKLRVY